MLKMAKTHTLKLGGAEPILPGLALPEAFESLDKRIESTVQFCRLKGSIESQILGLVTVCQEMQRLLKFAFIENGLLASRIEILTRHQSETLKKMDKKLSEVETEHKVTKKQIKRLRKRLSEYETIQRKTDGEWWDVKVSSSDYESLTTLSRSAGFPDLDFMLRINQILIDFVKDQNKNELVLPPMGNDERAEVSKIASIYKLRCRYGKSTQLAPSTLIKARQTCIPLTGEVDSLLENFAKTHRRVGNEDGGDIKPDSPTKPDTSHKGTDPQTPSSLTISDIPPTMLTPLSSLSSPNTIDIGSTPISVTPAQSPTGIAMPNPSTTDQSSKTTTRKTTSTSSTGSSSSSTGQPVASAHSTAKPPSGKVGGQPHPQPHQPLPGQPSSSSSSSSESPGAQLQKGGGSTEAGKTPGSGGGVAGSGAAIGGGGVVGSAGGDHVTPGKTSAGHGVVTATAVNQRQATHSTSTQGNIYISHQGHVRPIVPPTVVASPLKFPLSQLPTTAAVHGNVPAGNTPTTTAATGGGGGAGGGATGGGGVAGGGGVVAGSGEVGGGGKRERESSTASPGTGGTPSKRVRVTRKSASGNGEE